MITNPIINIKVMIVICIVCVIIILYNSVISKMVKKDSKSKKMTSIEMANIWIKLGIVILLFIMNLRIMIPNGETTMITTNMDVLFVIDTSVSMNALDYDGGKERMTGVIDDCCHIVDELAGAQFSIITFGDTAEKVVPFTPDGDMIQTELKTLKVVDSYYAKGTSLNLVKDVLEKTLKEQYEKRGTSNKLVIFYISDGEITKDGERLESFSNINKYVSGGAVLGYGTTQGG